MRWKKGSRPLFRLPVHRFRLRSLLLLTGAVAICTATFRPFDPELSIELLEATPVTEPYSKYPEKHRQLRFKLRNSGLLPFWLMPNDESFLDDSWLASPATGQPAHLGVYGWDDSEYTKLAAGEARVYDLVLSSEHEAFELFVDVRDWRGRQAYKFLGRHRAVPGDGRNR